MRKCIYLPKQFVEDSSSHPLTSSTFFTIIGVYYNDRNHLCVRPHGTESNILIFCYKGRGWYSVNGQKRRDVEQLSVIILPANLPHEYGSYEHDPWSIYWFHLQGTHFSYFFSDAPKLVQSVHIKLSESSTFLLYFNEIYERFEQGYSLESYIYASQILKVMLAYLRKEINNDPYSLRSNDYIYRYALQYMQDHLEKQEISLHELASFVGMSVPHFIKIFRKSAGYPPIQYYLRLKIQKACEYLDFTDMTIREIGEKLGIRDAYYFSRLFKKITGDSPRVYRNKMKG
jgi:AraC-like DNA-binding protein